MKTRALTIIAVAGALALPLPLTGCGKKAPPDPYLGNMTDTTWAGLADFGNDVKRQSAAGTQVSMSDFQGRFVWADYAGPWCKPCVDQAGAIKRLEGAFPEVVFLTIMTSKSSKYEDVPDRKTAQSWAARFGFRTDRVLVADNLWAKTIPMHILFSPEGHTIYRWTGGLAGEKISEVLKTRMADWQRWSKTGEKAAWMK